MLTLEQAALANGMQILTVKEFSARFAALGYKLDRSMDCRSNARFMTGEYAGEVYPCVTTDIREIDTGMSAFHYQARRDENFKAMQKLRGEICAITRGALLEV